MVINYYVYKAKVTCIRILDSKLYPLVVGVTLRHPGMQLHGDLIEQLWLQDSEFMG